MGSQETRSSLSSLTELCRLLWELSLFQILPLSPLHAISLRAAMKDHSALLLPDLPCRLDEEQDVRLFIQPDERLLSTFQRIADEMRSDKGGKRGIRLVESRDDAPDLVIIADGDDVHFEIMDKLCRRHGLTRMPFKVKIDASDTIHRVLRSSADFYWYLHHSSKGVPSPPARSSL